MEGSKGVKILGLSFGRKGANCQALCVEALSAAQAQGAQVELIHMRDLDIRDCRGCFACSRLLATERRSGCPIRDDFDWLREKILDADGIIFSMPVFRLGAPSPFFRLLERFGVRDDLGFYLRAREEGDPLADSRILRKRPVAFLGVGGTDYVTNFRSDCLLFSTMMLWPTVDMAVMDWNKSVFAQEERLQRSHALGLALARAAIQGSGYEPYAGFCPRCGGDRMVLSKDGTAECSACRCKGTLSLEDGILRFHPLPEEENFIYGTPRGKIRHTQDVEENNRLRAQLSQTQRHQALKEYYQNRLSFSSPR